MADGPIDYDRGYLFESQKSISDRRAARGLPIDPSGTGRSHVSGSSGGGNFLIMLLFGVFILVGKSLVWIAPHALKFMGWLLWQMFELMWTILSGGRRR